MRARGIGDRLLTGGGIIPNDDMAALGALGVGRLFGPGTNTQDIVAYIREWYARVHGASALPPLPPPPSPAGADDERRRAARPQAGARACGRRGTGARGEAAGALAFEAGEDLRPPGHARPRSPRRKRASANGTRAKASAPKRRTRSTGRKRG
jgi:hypothetical protein